MKSYKEYQEAWNHIKTLKGSNVGAYYCNFTDSKIAFEEDEVVVDELVERAKPKKPICENIPDSQFTIATKVYYCPECGMQINNEGECCPNNYCRQELDWSDEK